ncbi:hypothetical protein ID0050_13370 [Helicobacter pylori]
MKKASQVLFFGALLSSSLQGFEAKLNALWINLALSVLTSIKSIKKEVSTLCSNSQRLRAI